MIVIVKLAIIHAQILLAADIQVGVDGLTGEAQKTPVIQPLVNQKLDIGIVNKKVGNSLKKRKGFL
jgi:hypothetical protein